MKLDVSVLAHLDIKGKFYFIITDYVYNYSPNKILIFKVILKALWAY